MNEPKIERPHISNSQLDMFTRCGEQYRRRYIEKEIIPPGISFLIGSGCHKGAEANFSQKIESHQDLPKADIIDAAVAGYEEELDGGYLLTADEEAIGAKNVLGKAKDEVAALAEVHADQQAPDYQPIAVEKRILIPFPSASHDMLGYIDLVDDRRRVTDFKTAARKKNQAEVDNSTQLSIYAAAYQVEHGEPPAEVRLDIMLKTKKPGRQVLTSTRTQRDFEVLVNRINTMLYALEKGVFMPAPVGSWCCSPKFCGYWHSCPHVNAQRAAAAEE